MGSCRCTSRCGVWGTCPFSSLSGTAELKEPWVCAVFPVGCRGPCLSLWGCGCFPVHTFLEKSGVSCSQVGCLIDVFCQHLLLWATCARSALRPSMHCSHRGEGLTSWLGRAWCGLCTLVLAMAQPAACHWYPSDAVVSWNLCEGDLWGT